MVRRGKTPALTAEQARELLGSIDTSKIAGLRDRAIIGVMVQSSARVGAVCGMKVKGYYQNGKRWRLRDWGLLRAVFSKVGSLIMVEASIKGTKRYTQIRAVVNGRTYPETRPAGEVSPVLAVGDAADSSEPLDAR